jgi:hypothetical protein
MATTTTTATVTTTTTSTTATTTTTTTTGRDGSQEPSSTKELTEEQLAALVGSSRNRKVKGQKKIKVPTCIGFVIMPDSTFRTTWDGFIALFVMYLIWKIPYGATHHTLNTLNYS